MTGGYVRSLCLCPFAGETVCYSESFMSVVILRELPELCRQLHDLLFGIPRPEFEELINTVFPLKCCLNTV